VFRGEREFDAWTLLDYHSLPTKTHCSHFENLH